uniref:TIGR04076 family protein n=1 Tax=Caldisericum exile TaxID=693075 RepID=A0A7C4U465_9BACT
MKIYKIKIKVVEVRGICTANLKVGDEFEIDSNGQPVPINFCGWAFVTLWPFITPLRYGGTLPWERDPNKAYVSCPDPYNTVVFEICRYGEEYVNEDNPPAF